MGSCLDPNRYQPVFANAAQRNAALLPTTGGLHGFNGYRPDTLRGEIEDSRGLVNMKIIGTELLK